MPQKESEKWNRKKNGRWNGQCERQEIQLA